MKRPILRIALTRLLIDILKRMGRQASTAPGRVLLRLCPDILARLAQNKQILLVTGTNGKTTTVRILVHLLRTAGFTVRTNASGANLATGLITCLVQDQMPADFWVLEMDEAAFARWAHVLRPLGILVTNIFRDQLDRYGEMATVHRLLQKGTEESQPPLLVLNADDPLVADLHAHSSHKPIYYGIDFRSEEEVKAVPTDWSSDLDAIACPRCGRSLQLHQCTVGHLGDFDCSHCGFKRPVSNYLVRTVTKQELLLERPGNENIQAPFPLQGLYNAYNACAAFALADSVSLLQTAKPLPPPVVKQALRETRPAFGRQERISIADNKTLCLLLSKNPDGLQQNLILLQEAQDLGAAVFCMNSRLADGCDFSWIWDAPFERIQPLSCPIVLSGERGGDLLLRLSHAGYSLEPNQYYENPIDAVEQAVASAPSGSCVYVLVNYTAMLALRQELGERYAFNWKWEEK